MSEYVARSLIMSSLTFVSALAERKVRDAQVRATINQKLIESGEKEKYDVWKNLFVHFVQIKRSSPSKVDRMRLERRNEAVLQGYAKNCECGSNYSFSAEIIKTKGLEHVTVDDLVAEITPKGRGTFGGHRFLFSCPCSECT